MGRATVAIVGLGSIGGGIAGSLLAADRHDIVACTRQKLDRLVLERPEGKVDLALRVLIDPAAAGEVDWVLLCTKTYETPSTAPWLARLCGASTRLAVDHVRFRHAGPYDLAVADDAGGRAFAQLLEGTPLRLRMSEDLMTLKWRKLLLNAVANPITALTRQRQAVFRRADIGALCLAILEEAVAIARAGGARLADDEATQSMATLLTYPPDAGTSMYFDVIVGRPLEVEALTGAIVTEGERHGIAAPLNRALLSLLRAINDAAMGVP